MSIKVSPVSSNFLKNQRKEAEQRIDDLRQQQVDALEQGLEFEHNSEILIVSERIAALDRAIARAVQRERAEEERRERTEARADIETMKETLKRDHAEHLDLIAEAEAAATKAAELFKSIETKGEALRQRAVSVAIFLKSHKIAADEPNEYGPNLSIRLGDYFSSAMCKPRRGENRPNQMGQVSWQNAQPLDHSWREAEFGRMIGPLNARIKGLDQILAGLQEPEDLPLYQPGKAERLMSELAKARRDDQA